MYIKITFEQGTGFDPRIVRVLTDATLSQVTTAGWLNGAVQEGMVIQPSDKILVYYGIGGTPGNAFFDVAISAGVITLSLTETNVVLPVVSGDFAVFSGTAGAIADLGYLPSDAAKTVVAMVGSAVQVGAIAHFTDIVGTIDDTAGAVFNLGNIYAGASGTAGVLRSYPSAATTGYLGLTGVANAADYAVQIANVSHNQASIHSLPDPANAAARILVGATATPFVSGNFPVASGTGGLMVDSGVAAAKLDSSLSSATAATNKVFVKTITATAAALATSGHVAVMAAPSGTSQFKILNIRVMYAAAGLSGGGGDRLLTLTDGTIVFNQAGITAALLGTPIYTLWGGTGNPIPGAVSTISTAGAAIYLVYAGGTTDFTTGQIVIEIELAQITA